MADDKKKATIVIKKVKKGGGHGHHGGAWKVAYADFVTAMMAFFMVMWLLGADEETKASISNYFNNPTAAWRPELKTPDTIPLGNQTGAGDDVLKGADGEVPEDLVQTPSPVIDREPGSVGSVQSDGDLSGEDIAAADSITFSIPETDLLAPNDSKIIHGEKNTILQRLRRVTRQYKGRLVIRGAYEDFGDISYEAQNHRIVAIKQFMVDRHWASDEMTTTALARSREGHARTIEFTFSKRD